VVAPSFDFGVETIAPTFEQTSEESE